MDERYPRRTLVLRGVAVGLGGEIGSVRVQDGVVVAIGPDADINDADGTGADDVVHAPRATLLPGLRDEHVHAEQWARHRDRVDVLAAGSAADVVAMVQAAHRARAGTDLLDGHGFRHALWPEQPHRNLFDAAMPGVPVAVTSMDLHTIWLSGAACALAGFPGHPTGVLREEDAFTAGAALGHARDTGRADDAAAAMTGDAAAQGVTGVVDFEFADSATTWSRRSGRGDLAVRVDAAVWTPWLDAAVRAGRRTGDVLPGTGGMVRVGPYKVVTDGSLNTCTAFCHDPYPGLRSAPERFGLQLVPPAELADLLRTASSAGLLPAVHAIGDRANADALSAFEEVGCGGRIEHAQLVRPADVARFAALGLVASVQPQHAVSDRDVADRLWAGRTPDAFPYGALHRAGIRLLLGSDAPVSPLAPWSAIADAVARTDDDRPPWHPEQALPLEVAVAASCGGRVRPAVGDPADLTLVGADPRRLNPSELREIPVLATVVDGRVTHQGW